MRRRSSTYLASFDSFMPKVTKAKGQRMPHALRVSAHHAALVGDGSIRRTRGVWVGGEACVARVRRGGLQPRASMFLLLVKCSLVRRPPALPRLGRGVWHAAARVHWLVVGRGVGWLLGGALRGGAAASTEFRAGVGA